MSVNILAHTPFFDASIARPTVLILPRCRVIARFKSSRPSAYLTDRGMGFNWKD